MREISWKHITFDADEYLDRILTKNEIDKEDTHIPANIVDTPFGPSEVLNPFDMVKDFDFYVANTNFRLSWQEEGNIQNEVEGIEGYRRISQYRFVVAIGEMFNPFSVQFNIGMILCIDKYLELAYDTQQELEKLDKLGKRFFIFINQDLQLSSFVDDGVTSFEPSLREAELYQAKNGGKIIKNFSSDGTIFSICGATDMSGESGASDDVQSEAVATSEAEPET